MDVLFALFENRGQEEAAIQETVARGFSQAQCRVTAYRDRISEGDLKLTENDAIRCLVFGVVGGYIGGAILGAVLGALTELLGLGPFTAMVTGAFGCALLGGVLGALLAAGRRRRRRRRLSRDLRRGKVLVIAESAGVAVREAIRGIFQKHGAHELEWTVSPS